VGFFKDDFPNYLDCFVSHVVFFSVAVWAFPFLPLVVTVAACAFFRPTVLA